MEDEFEEMKILTRAEYLFYNDNICYDKKKTINQINSKTKNIIQLNPDFIKYELIIEKNEDDQLVLTISEKNINSIKKYKTFLVKEDLIKLSPYFKLLNFINPLFFIDLIYSFLKSILDNNIFIRNENYFNLNNNDFINIIKLNNSKIYISHLNESDNNLFFIFDITYCNLQKEEITIELEKIEQTENEDALKIIQFLIKNKYNYLERISFLKKKLRKAQKVTEKYEKLLDTCNMYFGQNMTLKMSFVDMGIDTDIFFSREEYNFVIKNISKTLKRKILKLNQIYKASCNGDNINAFHQNCKNIPNTLILIITDDKRKFGGFTQAEWDNSNKTKFDDKAFLFSLDNNEIYPILDEYKNKAINCREDFYAPIFGEDLFLFDGFFSSQLNKTKEKYYNYSDSIIKDNYKLSGQEYFTVTEMEVYEVIFRNS